MLSPFSFLIRCVKIYREHIAATAVFPIIFHTSFNCFFLSQQFHDVVFSTDFTHCTSLYLFLFTILTELRKYLKVTKGAWTRNPNIIHRGKISVNRHVLSSWSKLANANDQKRNRTIKNIV